MQFWTGAEQCQRNVSCYLGLLLIVAGLCGCSHFNPNVTTQHNDSLRTGAYLAETSLTPGAVGTRGMHVKYWLAPQGWLPAYPRTRPAGSIDGTIDTQMLYMRNSVGPANVNGLVVATSANKVYGLNADTGACVWESYLMHGDVQTLKDSAGGCTGQVSVPPMPERRCLAPGGVHSTPVIDEVTHRLYVLYTTTFVYDGDGCTVLPGTAGYWLARLSLTDGTADRVVPVSASVARADGSRLNFVADHQYDRTGLLLQNGSVYISFGAAGWREANDFYQYRGWVMRYSAGDLSLQGVFCTAANTTPQEKIDVGGSGIWQGGGGLAADPNDQQSNVYFLTGNGLSGLPTDWSPYFKSIHAAAGPPDSYGDSFVKLRPQGGKLVPSAYVPLDALDLLLHDADLGSGGAMLMPGTNLVIGGGKTGILYLLDRNSMKSQGQFEASTNQYHPWMRGQTWNQGPHLHGAPTYFDVGSFGYLYVWGEKDMLRSYRFDKSTQKFDVDSSTPPHIKLFAHGDIVALEDTMPGGMLSVSASGANASSGIVWATLPIGRCPQGLPCPPARSDPVPPLVAAVYAFHAETLKLLWNDEIGDLAHWVPPTIADGKVFVAAAEAKTGEPWTGKIIVYELCESGRRDCAGKASPIQPRGVVCEDCHIDFKSRIGIPADANVHTHADASHRSILWGWQAEISTLLPSGHVRSIAFQASGEQVYQARSDAKSSGALIWQPQENTAELVEIPRDPNANSRSLMKATLRDSTWLASDGSTATASLVQTASTPGGSSLDWALFKIAKSSGRGALNGQSYIRRVYTRGGQAPDTSPRRLGEIARVPYDCQFWFYAPPAQLR